MFWQGGGIMSATKHHVELTLEQRAHVEKLARSNKASIRERARARILLAVDEAQPGGGQKDADAAKATGGSVVTAAFVRQRFVRRGLEATLHHREKVRRKARKLDRVAEAHPVALVCGAPPQGMEKQAHATASHLRILQMKVQEKARTGNDELDGVESLQPQSAGGRRRIFRPFDDGAACITYIALHPPPSLRNAVTQFSSLSLPSALALQLESGSGYFNAPS